MADKALCTIPNCGKVARARTLCPGHYRRLRETGSTSPEIPLASRTPRAVAEAFIEAALASTDKEACILWPFGTSAGYGTVHGKRSPIGVHRIVCERRHGPPPVPDMEASHSCNVRRCISPHHLRWDTVAGNLADRWEHGTIRIGEKHWQAKLTEADVRTARMLYRTGQRSLQELTDLNCVSKSAMWSAIKGKTWGWLTD